MKTSSNKNNKKMALLMLATTPTMVDKEHCARMAALHYGAGRKELGDFYVKCLHEVDANKEKIGEMLRACE